MSGMNWGANQMSVINSGANQMLRHPGRQGPYLEGSDSVAQGCGAYSNRCLVFRTLEPLFGGICCAVSHAKKVAQDLGVPVQQRSSNPKP